MKIVSQASGLYEQNPVSGRMSKIVSQACMSKIVSQARVCKIVSQASYEGRSCLMSLYEARSCLRPV